MLVIREATRADVQTVFDLILAIARHHDQEHYVVTTPAELEEAGFGDTPSFGVLLAEIDGEIAGYASYTWNYGIWLGGSYMNIDDVFVWERFRGQEVGKALMLKAKEVCRARGAKRLKWEVQEDNNSAIRFYQRLGAEIEVKGVCRWEVT